MASDYPASFVIKAQYLETPPCLSQAWGGETRKFAFTFIFKQFNTVLGDYPRAFRI
jgi:hypothetical protein